jgi:endonuclease/exonuclease/phosphatase family metal-dependent hydrolase
VAIRARRCSSLAYDEGPRVGYPSAVRRRPSTAGLVLVLAATLGCRTGRNYVETSGPRYVGGPAAAGSARERAATGPLRVVSFNIERARHVDRAIEVMEAQPALRDADILLLQEMDEAGTRRVAEALGMSYVYYPGTFSLKTRRDFGNAVLSRWPIVSDSKLLLPHFGILGRLQRTATGATIRVGESLIRVYSTHLGTMINATPAAQRAQLRTILADAEPHARVIIGGDMNSHGVVRLARRGGYEWPTEHGPRTTRFGRWDHILLKGFESPGAAAAGTVLDVRGASDHRPVWALAALR